MEHVETLEVHVGAIHHVERTRLRHNGIEDVDVVQFSFGNLNKCGDRAAQIEQGVHLDGGFVRSKPSPRKHRQAEIDGRGVQGIDRVVKIEAERLVGIHRARDVDEHLREVSKDTPVVCFVGVSQRGACNLAAKAYVIELASHGAQAGFDVAETFSKGQLGKGETKKLIEAGKSAPFVIAAIAFDALVELVRWEVIDQLGEDGAADMHAPLSVRAAEWDRTG